MSTLTGWDWLLGGLVFVSVALGFLRGLVRTAFALASWVIALAGALLGGPLLVTTLGIAAPLWALALPVFLVLFLITRYVGALIARGLAAVGLGGLDRLLGGAVGAARAVIIFAIIALAAAVVGFDRDAAWRDARCRPLLDEITARLIPHLPVRPGSVLKSA
jgi:membrane protein required for colicin V production